MQLHLPLFPNTFRPTLRHRQTARPARWIGASAASTAEFRAFSCSDSTVDQQVQEPCSLQSMNTLYYLRYKLFLSEANLRSSGVRPYPTDTSNRYNRREESCRADRNTTFHRGRRKLSCSVGSHVVPARPSGISGLRGKTGCWKVDSSCLL